MSNAKHSPTPWAVSDFAGDDGTRVVVDASGHIVAGPIEYRRYESCTIVEGLIAEDARLIAAAPEMLAELETLWSVFNSYAAHHLAKGDMEKAKANFAITDRIAALIKKASKA